MANYHVDEEAERLGGNQRGVPQRPPQCMGPSPKLNRLPVS